MVAFWTVKLKKKLFTTLVKTVRQTLVRISAIGLCSKGEGISSIMNTTTKVGIYSQGAG